jgi:hypothetical protein
MSRRSDKPTLAVSSTTAASATVTVSTLPATTNALLDRVRTAFDEAETDEQVRSAVALARQLASALSRRGRPPLPDDADVAEIQRRVATGVVPSVAIAAVAAEAAARDGGDPEVVARRLKRKR